MGRVPTARDYWTIANYIVAFVVGQTLIFLYTLGQMPDGIRKLFKTDPFIFKWIVVLSIVAYIVMILVCYWAERYLSNSYGIKERLSWTPELAMIGRVVAVGVAGGLSFWVVSRIDYYLLLWVE